MLRNVSIRFGLKSFAVLILQSATGFKVRRVEFDSEPKDELSSLAIALDIFKDRTEDIIKVHELTLMRNANGNSRVFDPAVIDRSLPSLNFFFKPTYLNPETIA